MGRITELLDFINRESIPSPQTREFIYHHINIDNKLLNSRRVYRNGINGNDFENILEDDKYKMAENK